MTKEWTPDELLEISRAYQRTSLLMAAAELDVFAVLASEPMSSDHLATALEADRRVKSVEVSRVEQVGREK